jgi:hypothetical protein
MCCCGGGAWSPAAVPLAPLSDTPLAQPRAGHVASADCTDLLTSCRRQLRVTTSSQHAQQQQADEGL